MTGSSPAPFEPDEGQSRMGPKQKLVPVCPAEVLPGRSAPMATFSSADMERNRRMFWNVRPRPMAARSCGAIAVMSRPSSRMRPAVGRYKPESTLSVVVLPEPFGPISAWMPPRPTLKLTPSTAFRPPKCLASASTSSAGVPARALDRWVSASSGVPCGTGSRRRSRPSVR